MGIVVYYSIQDWLNCWFVSYSFELLNFRYFCNFFLSLFVVLSGGQSEREMYIPVHAFFSSAQFHFIPFDSIWFDSAPIRYVCVGLKVQQLSVRRSFIMLNSLISNNSKFCDICFINSIEKWIERPGSEKNEPSEKTNGTGICINTYVSTYPSANIPKTQYAIQCDFVWEPSLDTHTRTHSVYWAFRCVCVRAYYFCARMYSVDVLALQDTLAFLEHVVLCGFMSLLRYSHFSAFLNLPLFSSFLPAFRSRSLARSFSFP